MEPGLGLAYVLIAAGFLLLVAELFIPSGGILSVLSVGSIAVGVVLVFTDNPQRGWWTLLGVFLALPIFGAVLFKIWPKTPMGKKLFLNAQVDDRERAMMPEHEELESLRGKIGQTISLLRPAGMVDFDGRRVDSITEGMMIQVGQWVRCVDVQAGKVVVRPVEKPNLDSRDTAGFN